jgi:hypothetical protein
MELYIHSHIRLHGVVLNSLSTGTTLSYLYTKYELKYGMILYIEKLRFIIGEKG